MKPKHKSTKTIFLFFFIIVIIFSNCNKDEVNKIKDNEITYGSVFDIEGNEYKTVIIGKQEWMAENLRSTKFSDGGTIFPRQGNDEWLTADYASYTVYPFDEINGFNSQEEVIQVYGLLYNWYTIENESLCPSGWYIPTLDEWEALAEFLGGNLVAGGKLKEIDNNLWKEPNTSATNEVGFNGMPGGFRSGDGSFKGIGETGKWWTSTISGRENFSANCVGMFYNSSYFGNVGDLPFYLGSSIRCFRPIHDVISTPSISTTKLSDITKTSVKTGGNVTRDGGGNISAKGIVWGETSNPNITENNGIANVGSGLGSFEFQVTGLDPNTTYYLRAFATNNSGTTYGVERVFKTYGSDAIVDIDGNFYDIVTIGNQIWLKENLKVKHYSNGDPIISNLDNPSWESTTSGSYSVYPQDDVYGITTEKEMITAYGILYNWYSVTDQRGLCPDGFHVPGKDDWETLHNFIASVNNQNIGKQLKSARQYIFGAPFSQEHPGWNNQFENYIGTDNFGFSALPAGNRNSNGSYNNIGDYAWWWSVTEVSSSYSYNGYLTRYSNDFIYINQSSKHLGFSVRCLKNDI